MNNIENRSKIKKNMDINLSTCIQQNSLIGYIVLINFYKLAEFPSEILFLNGNEQIKQKIEYETRAKLNGQK